VIRRKRRKNSLEGSGACGIEKKRASQLSNLAKEKIFEQFTPGESNNKKL